MEKVWCDTKFDMPIYWTWISFNVKCRKRMVGFPKVKVSNNNQQKSMLLWDIINCTEKKKIKGIIGFTKIIIFN